MFFIFIFSKEVLGNCSGISFIDSTILTVCHVRRINSHCVFKNMAKRRKTSTGWFYGFKLSRNFSLLAYSTGNLDDRAVVLDLTKQ